MIAINKKIAQAGSLYISSAAGSIIAFGTTVLNTRLLGPNQYGDLRFLQNLFVFCASLLTFGVFFSGGRLLALKRYENYRQKLIGNLFIFAAVISIVLFLVLLIFSYFEERIFNNNLEHTIRLFLPLLFVLPFQLCFEDIMQGDNRIIELSLFRFIPNALFLSVALFYSYFIPI